MRTKLRTLYEKHGDILRYLVIGGLTTLIDMGLFALLVSGFGVYYQTANVIVWVLAVSFAFVGNKWVVFRTKTKSPSALWKEAASFFAMRLVTLLFSAAFLYGAVDLLVWNENLAKLLCNIAVVILNYILSKLVVFRAR